MVGLSDRVGLAPRWLAVEQHSTLCKCCSETGCYGRGRMWGRHHTVKNLGRHPASGQNCRLLRSRMLVKSWYDSSRKGQTLSHRQTQGTRGLGVGGKTVISQARVSGEETSSESRTFSPFSAAHKRAQLASEKSAAVGKNSALPS